MRRNSMMTVKKSLAVMVAAAMVMSQGVVAFAETATSTVMANNTTRPTEEEGKIDGVKVTKEFDAIGVIADSSDGKETKVTIDGGVEADGSSYAIGAITQSYDPDSKTEVEIRGDVKASSNDVEKGVAKGVEASATDGGSISVETGGIRADSNKTAKGIDVVNESGKSSIDVIVNGDIKAEGENAYGIAAENLGEGTTFTASVSGDIIVSNTEGEYATSEGVNISTLGTAEVTVSGDITSEGNGIMLSDTVGVKVDETYQLVSGENTNISVNVVGDVTAGDTVVEVIKGNKDSEIAVTVEGTIKGEHNLVLVESGDGVVTDGLSVTVWKIDTSGTGGRTAEVKSYNSTSESSSLSESKVTYTDYSDEAAAVINYIIKVDDTSKLSANKDTAKEGEQVFLEVNVPSGYDIDSFYTAEGGTAVDVVKDSSGRYYLVVPRGGGVFVGVSLKANSNSKRYNDDNQPGPTESDGDGSGSGNSKRSEVPGRMGPGSPDNLGGKVNAGQTVRVGGQEINTNVIVKDAGEAVKNTFTATLSTTALTGLFDFGGAFVAVPADAAVKESFTFTAEGLDGFVTTYLEIADYKTGDVILCSYMDASGAMVTLVVTPDMINGTTLLLTIPANCTLALAGSGN